MQGTNSTLLSMHNEINKMQGSILAIFLRGKIQQFYNDNGVRIDSVNAKIAALQKEYFVIEEDIIKKDEEKNTIMQEGKDRKELDDKIKEILDTEITITT